MLLVTIPLSESIQSMKLLENNSYLIKKHANDNIMEGKNNNVHIRVYYLDVQGNFNKMEKTLSNSTYNRFLQQISHIPQGAMDLIQFLQQKIQIMKSYDLVPSNLSLDNIIEKNTVDALDFFPLNLTHATYFQSNFAPLFILGMGFGLGFGYRRLPVFPRLAGNIISVGFIGYGGVLCLDIQDEIIYYQFTTFFPYLIHIISGFIGIMMFAFDNIFPPESGLPFTFYTNFIGIGIAGVAVGFEFPPQTQ
jgi:hypothetical protein